MYQNESRPNFEMLQILVTLRPPHFGVGHGGHQSQSHLLSISCYSMLATDSDLRGMSTAFLAARSLPLRFGSFDKARCPQNPLPVTQSRPSRIRATLDRPTQMQGGSVENEAEEPVGLIGLVQYASPSKWPERVRVVFLSFVSFILCNADRLNFSVAILPMADHYGWSLTQQGVAQSAFFGGYLVTQVPGGWYVH